MLLFFPLMTLLADAARVIEMRLRMMALGQSTPGEMVLMVSEKMNALAEFEIEKRASSVSRNANSFGLAWRATPTGTANVIGPFDASEIERCWPAGPIGSGLPV